MAMFGSPSPFGASSSTPFGGSGPSTSPFGGAGQNASSPFGVNQGSNPFGAKPFGSSPFGGGGSLFGSGTATGVFGATQQSSAFGASTTTPTFGAPSTAFGSGATGGAFGQKPTTSFGGFGTTPAQANPFGSPFGQTQPAFGSTPAAFGAASSAAPAFGTTGTPFGGSNPAFGATSTPAFGMTASTPFGASSPAFGSTSVFGQSAPAFGASSSPAFGSTSVFGQSSPAFGASSSTAFGSTPFGGASGSPFGAPQSASAFGSTPSVAFGTSAFGAPFGGQRGGSRVAAYAVTNDPDVGVSGQVGKFMSISAMAAYIGKSPEELRWEDYQANDKGGVSTSPNQPASGGIFGQATSQTISQTPFGSASASFGQAAATPNPFASTTTPSVFGQKPSTGFGAASTPVFGTSSTPAFGQQQGLNQPQSPFAAPTALTGFGQASTPAFGSTPSMFGANTGVGFGGTSSFGSMPALGTSIFGNNTTGFAFASQSMPTSISAASPFGVTSSVFGQSQLAASSFGTAASQGFGAPTPAFGASSTPAFGQNIFNTGGMGSVFNQTKPASLTQTTPPSTFSGFGQGTSTFPNFQASQPGMGLFNGTPALGFGQNTSVQPQAANNIMLAMPQPSLNPFGALPAMPHMSIGRSATSVPSVQYGISSMPVSDRPTQVRTTSLLTPRHISQRAKVRMHGRRYHPKKDTPKVSFFSDGEEYRSTPKADVLFVPRENPRALFIRPTEQQSPTLSMASKGIPDARDISTPLQRNGAHVDNQETTNGPSSSPPDFERPVESWQGFDAGEEKSSTPPLSSKSADRVSVVKSGSKMTVILEEHSHRSNGFSSVGHRAGEAAIAYEFGADIEAILPTLRHSDYFTEPRIQEMAAKERSDPGYCRRVHDFVVGRRGFGSVKFWGTTDVRRLDLEKLIQFNKCEILVYMDESQKPSRGLELNKPAEVSLLNVKCVDKKTGQHFTGGPEVERFEKRLKKKTEEQDAEFTAYDAVKGEWRFQVKHFSRYGLDDSEDEEILQSGPGQALVVAGMDMMEGVEEDTSGSPTHLHRKSPDLSEHVTDIEGDDTRLCEVRGAVPHTALSHSLPVQLRLDPLKMQQMRSLFFSLEDEFGGMSAFYSAKSHASYARQGESFMRSGAFDDDQKESGEEAVHSVWPHGLPWKGVATKRMKLTCYTSWKPSIRDLHIHPSNLEGSDALSLAKLSVSLHGAGDLAELIEPRDGGFSIDSSSKSESVVVGRSGNIVDACLFFGQSFRVGWGPGGVLVHSGALVGGDVVNAAISSHLHIERVALDNMVRDEEGNSVEELVELQYVSPLKLHMSASSVKEAAKSQAGDELSLRNVVCNRSDLSRFCGEYGDLIHKQHGVKGLSHDIQVALHHQVTVWQLVEVLFASIVLTHDTDEEKESSKNVLKSGAHDSMDPVKLLMRRAEFSRWLQTSVSHLVDEDLQQLEGEDDMEEIFFMLTGRKVDDAVLKANLRGDVRLACLLSQAGASLKSRSDVQQQLSVWETDGLDHSLINSQQISVYRLLAGNILGALENREIDWKRFLGLIMWYQLAPDTNLSAIITTYQQFMSEKKKFLPTPMYVEEGYGSSVASAGEVYDTSYYLMLLHASKEEVQVTDIKRMFSSASTTFDRLDHRLAWHQQSFLQAIGILEPLQLYELDMNFVAQLLAAGLCHWAIYVVLHMPVSVEYPGLHESVVKEILCQYCETWSNSEYQQGFMEQELGVPAKWLQEALALYFKYLGDPLQELVHLIKSSQWHRAQTLFMTAVAASLFTNSEHSELWKFVSQLQKHRSEMENWELAGGIFFDFYNLKSSLSNEVDALEVLDTLEQKTAACKAFFARLTDSEHMWMKVSTGTLKLAYSQMANELASLLLVDAYASSQNVSEEVLGLEAVVEAPVPDHICASHIQGAVSAYMLWLSEADAEVY